MSGTNFLPGALSLASQIASQETALGAAMQTGILFLRRSRYIGTIIPDVAIEEQQSDRVQLTQHPVAVGSPVSDHAYRMPSSVTMRAGWSNSTPGVELSWGYSRIESIYKKLVTLQGNLQPFTLTTGKRTYQNMMLTELSVRTDRTTEQALIVEAHFQEVMRVTTKSTTQPAQEQQTQPQTTQSTETTTQQQAAPVTSGLSSWTGSQVTRRQLGAAP